MRKSFLKSHAIYRPVIILAIVCVMIGIPLASGAQTQVTVTITNNSSREIRYIYYAPAGTDNWGADQLNGAVIGAGTSYTLNNVTGGSSGVKIIAEDQNGCFLYNTVSGTENVTWTITNSEAPDCGG